MPDMRNRLSLFLFLLLGLLGFNMVHAECTREQMADAFDMRLYFYDVSGMADVFHERTVPFIKALESKVKGKDIFPDDVCYDMNLVFQLADDTLAGGDGSIPLKTLGWKYTLDDLLERKIRFQKLYQERMAQGEPVPDYFALTKRMRDALDEFEAGSRSLSSAIDAVCLEYDEVINEMKRAAPSIDARPEKEGKPLDKLAAIRNHIMQKVTYPIQAQEAGISGTVICQLMVDEDGNIRDVTITRGAHPLLDQEVLRVVRLMPEYKPLPDTGGREPFAVSMPVRFHLQDR